MDRSTLTQFWQQPRSPKIAVLLALVGVVPGVPLAGLHKFYLRQPLWGVVYLSLFWLPIPHVASGIEAIWYLLSEPDGFDQRFNDGLGRVREGAAATQLDPGRMNAIAAALRDLEQLRQEGLISELEFEQKRRQLIDAP